MSDLWKIAITITVLNGGLLLYAISFIQAIDEF
jgi:hypothetical protein